MSDVLPWMSAAAPNCVGEANTALASRSICQRVVPEPASMPARSDWPGLSNCTITVSPSNKGDELMPTALRVLGCS